MIRILAAAALALAAFLGMAAPASACTVQEDTSTTWSCATDGNQLCGEAFHVPATASPFEALVGSGLMVGTDEECYSYVTPDASGALVWRDYSTDAAGELAPITACEGEEIVHTFTVGAIDEDGEIDYVLDDEL